MCICWYTDKQLINQNAQYEHKNIHINICSNNKISVANLLSFRRSILMKKVLTGSSQRPNSVKLWFHSNPQVSRRTYKTPLATMDDRLEGGRSQSVSRRHVEEGNLHWRPESNPNFLIFQVPSIDIVTRSRDCQTITVWFPAEANIKAGFKANPGPIEWTGKAAPTLKVMRPAYKAEN